ATSGLVTAIVTRPVALLDGSDDYIQLPADAPTPTFTATTGKYTIVYFGRWHVETGSTQRLFSTESSGNDGLHIHSNSAGVERPRITVGGATSAKGFNPPGAATLTERQAFVVAVVIDNGNAYAYLSGYGLSSAADITGVGTITHAAARVGSTAYAVSSLTAGEFFDVITYDGQAKTEAQLNAVAADLLAGNYT
ncbi:MAG: hypothetical protein GY941_29915, partial [Planctomycetes bacterium]|nr:hypothetical protein [Planctomycetota bacterium]